MIAWVRSQPRRLVLLAMLAVAAWLAVFGDKTPPGTPTQGPTAATSRDAKPRPGTVPQRSPAAARRIPAPDTTAAIEALVPRQELLPSPARGAGRDLFAAPPPPPSPKTVATPPPAPMAPALPYRFVGKKLEGGEWEVFLGHGEANHQVRVGSVLEGSYRIDRIEPPSMILTHLPTRQTQTLAIGDAW